MAMVGVLQYSVGVHIYISEPYFTTPWLWLVHCTPVRCGGTHIHFRTIVHHVMVMVGVLQCSVGGQVCKHWLHLHALYILSRCSTNTNTNANTNTKQIQIQIQICKHWPHLHLASLQHKYNSAQYIFQNYPCTFIFMSTVSQI